MYLYVLLNIMIVSSNIKPQLTKDLGDNLETVLLPNIFTNILKNILCCVSAITQDNERRLQSFKKVQSLQQEVRGARTGKPGSLLTGDSSSYYA